MECLDVLERRSDCVYPLQLAVSRAVFGNELKPVLRDGDEILIKFLPYREIVMTGRRISSR